MIFCPQVAGDTRFIFSFTAQGAAVQAAGGDLRLLEPAVRRPLQLLGAGLAGVRGAVRLPVIENIPIVADVQQTAMGVAQLIVGMHFILGIVQKQIPQIYQHAAKPEASVGTVTEGMAKIMVMFAGIHKAVFHIHLADGGSFKEGMVRKGSGLSFGGKQHLGLRFDGHHISLQFHHHAAVVAQIMPAGSGEGHLGGKTGIEPHPAVVVRQHTGIKGKLLAGFLAPYLAVPVMHLAVKLILPCRGIAYGHAHFPHEIKAPIRALGHIGGVEGTDAQFVSRVLASAIDDPFIPLIA